MLETKLLITIMQWIPPNCRKRGRFRKTEGESEKGNEHKGFDRGPIKQRNISVVQGGPSIGTFLNFVVWQHRTSYRPEILTCCVAETVRILKRNMGRDRAPTEEAIRKLVRKVREKGMLVDDRSGPRARTVRTPENIEAVAQSIYLLLYRTIIEYYNNICFVHPRRFDHPQRNPFHDSKEKNDDDDPISTFWADFGKRSTARDSATEPPSAHDALAQKCPYTRNMYTGSASSAKLLLKHVIKSYTIEEEKMLTKFYSYQAVLRPNEVDCKILYHRRTYSMAELLFCNLVPPSEERRSHYAEKDEGAIICWEAYR
ncbi:hypothetical protein G5I_10080 [Acromyrmex echinatior]|uniref:DUF4817 domain-containing protein n=1 Tax=Acromyrmex echinatior TaxID=103372 RepID=F4WVX3_ACREC|nr:hypothetical protein G5I_10080 [Acromyrmex echinatior]